MENQVRYCKLSIALLCLFVNNSFALDIITSAENAALLDIQQQHDVDSQLISANDKQSFYNKNKNEFKALALSINDDKHNYEKLLETLPEKVLTGEGVDEYFQEIEDIIVKIDELESEYITAGIALKEEAKIIAADYDKLNDLRTQKNLQLSQLKKKVVARLVDDLAKPSSVQKIDINGETLCSKFQSISDCLNENESVIISKTKKNEPFLNDRSVLLSYKVHGASMNMNGMLNYDVSMTFKPSYNNKVESLLNEKFGLKSAVITLESNVDAEWYVDGTKVGQGKSIQHEVALGRHGILASYQAEGQSTIEIIEGNESFNYRFKSSVAAPLMKKETPKAEQPKTVKEPQKSEKSSTVKEPQKAKEAQQSAKKTIKFMKPKSHDTATSTNSSAKSSSTKKVENKTTSKEWKDYLYFMGIEAESAEQQRTFSQ